MEVIAGKPSEEVLDYLLRRRSVKVQDICAPGPSKVELDRILTAAARVPDHGKLFPFHFMVFEGEAREEVGALIAESYIKDNPEAREDQVQAERERFMRAPTIVGVISRLRPGKHPLWEQLMTAGAAAQNFSLAAHASGYGVVWLSEWYSYHDDVKAGLGLDERDHIAGFMFLGSIKDAPEERDRPDMEKIVTHWRKGMALNNGDHYDREKFDIPKNKGFSA